MPEFDFSGLGTRSFEQIVQALGVAEIGGSVTVFGDGPDGGREATFEGTTSFRGLGADEEWNGYGVLQAKYLQRSKSTQEDGEWAIRQLAEEIGAYTKHGSKRRPPEYYVFATNVVLTPYPEKGSKDRIRELLESWSSSEHGPRGYAIWDRDQLTALLTVHDGVRRSYAAWTLAGDVLADLVEHIAPGRADLRASVPLFLQKELLRDQYAKLEQAGHSPDDPIPLATVFIDLPVSRILSESDQLLTPRAHPHQAQDYAVRTLLGEADARLEAPSSARDRFPGRVVLLGGPGQGKTTVGQYLCQLYRVALLASCDPDRVDADVQTEMGRIQSQAESADLALPGCRRLPFRIVLSEFAARIAADDDATVLQHLAAQFSAKTGSPTTNDDIKRLLANYPSFVVLDGLDEVPASSNRTKVIERMRDFEVDARAAGMDVFILITTRPQGYSDELSRAKYSHRALVPLSPSDAMAYGSLLASTRFGGDQDRVDRVRARLEAAIQGQATAWLMRSPLQVTIMVLLVDQLGHPPEERWALFNAYYELVSRREIERDIAPSRIIRENRHHIDQVHRRVGLFLQTRGEHAGGTDARLSLQEFHAVVLDYLDEEGFDPERAVELASELESAAAQRLVFLVGLEEGAVGFEVRSLQEFMAAEALLEGPDDLVLDRIRLVAPIEYWENSLLFAIGKLFKHRAYLRDALVQLCEDLNNEQNDYISARAAAGSRIASAVLGDNVAASFPKYIAKFAGIASSGLATAAGWDYSPIVASYSPATAGVVDTTLRAALTATARGYKARLSAWSVACGLTSSGKWDPGEWLALVEAFPELLESDGLWLALEHDYESPEILMALRKAALGLPPLEVLQRVDREGPPRESFLRLLRSGAPEDVEAAACVEVLEVLRSARSVRVALDGAGHAVAYRPVGGAVPLDAVLVAAAPAHWGLAARLAIYESAPSAASLATFLEALYDLNESDRRWYVDFCKVRASWPLAAVVVYMAERKLDGVALASRIRSGALGDAGLWGECQARWANGSTSLAELVQGAPADLPFVVDKNAPLAWRAVWPEYEFGPLAADRDAPLIRSLVEIASGDDIIGVSRIAWVLAAEVAVMGLYMSRLAPVPDKSARTRYSESFIEVLVAAGRVGECESLWLVEGLSHCLGAEGEVAPDVLGALDAVGLVLPTQSDVSPSVEAMARRALVGAPHRLGLLRFVASGAQRDAPFHPFDAQAHLPAPEVAGSPGVLRAVLIALARQAPLAEDHVRAFLDALPDDDCGDLSALFRAAELRPDSDEEFVRLARVVESEALRGGKPVGNVLLDVVADRAAGRVSQLSDIAVCERLDLPTLATGRALVERRERVRRRRRRTT